MAAGLSRTRRWAVLALAASLAAGACSSLERPSIQGDRVVLPTPLRSFDASVSATIGQLQAAVAAIGSRLEAPIAAYRPSEPQALLQSPRVVMRADLADPDEGYLVIYEAPDGASARLRADELAAYLGSGFGQTNYAADARFSVSVLEDTVIFSSWSPGRSSDPARAEAVFEAVASVGQPVEVVR